MFKKNMVQSSNFAHDTQIIKDDTSEINEGK